MAVGQDQILQAIEVVIEEAQSEGQRPQRRLHQTGLTRGVDEDRARRLAVERERLAAKVADGDL